MVASSGALRQVLDAWLLDRAFTVLSSEKVLAEVEGALAKPFFARRIPVEDRKAYVALLRGEVLLVTPRTEVSGVVRDPEDDEILAAALDGGARYLVTGDRDLLALGTFRGVEIVSPRELVDLIGLPR